MMNGPRNTCYAQFGQSSHLQTHSGYIIVDTKNERMYWIIN